MIELTDDERNYCIPTIGLIHEIFEGVDSLHLYQQLGTIVAKTQDIIYSSNVTTITNNLIENGVIVCAWIDNEFSKHSLGGRTHEIKSATLTSLKSIFEIFM